MLKDDITLQEKYLLVSMTLAWFADITLNENWVFVSLVLGCIATAAFLTCLIINEILCRHMRVIKEKHIPEISGKDVDVMGFDYSPQESSEDTNS